MTIFGFGRTQQVTLGAQLESKASELRTRQSNKTASASYLLAEAERAKQESAVAGIHAGAVERALSILEDAGVTL